MVSMNVIKNILPNVKTIVFLICILALSAIGRSCITSSAAQSYQAGPIIINSILLEDRSMGTPEYRLANREEWRQVKIIRGGLLLDTKPNMRLNIGDEVWTGPRSAVAIRFPNGSQLYLRSGSRIRIGSVFAFFGELFVRVRGAFQVDTDFVTAGAEGTEWVMLVAQNGDTRCTVLEGRVRFTSTENLWGPRLMTENRQIVTRGSRSAEITSATREQLNKINHWINQIDQLVQAPQPQFPTTDNNGPVFSFPLFNTPFKRWPHSGRDSGRDSGSNENYPNSNDNGASSHQNSGDILRSPRKNIPQDTIQRDDFIR